MATCGQWLVARLRAPGNPYVERTNPPRPQQAAPVASPQTSRWRTTPPTDLSTGEGRASRQAEAPTATAAAAAARAAAKPVLRMDLSLGRLMGSWLLECCLGECGFPHRGRSIPFATQHCNRMLFYAVVAIRGRSSTAIRSSGYLPNHSRMSLVMVVLLITVSIWRAW